MARRERRRFLRSNFDMMDRLIEQNRLLEQTALMTDVSAPPDDAIVIHFPRIPSLILHLPHTVRPPMTTRQLAAIAPPLKHVPALPPMISTT